MADFDINAYLATEDKKKGFDINAYLAQTEPTTTARKEQGKAFVSLADTALNTITGGLDALAYPLANYYYGTAGKMSPADAAARAQAETTSPKDVFGRAFGYKDQTTYENNPFRQAGNYIGQELGENVIQPLAQSTGLPEQSVGNMVGTATMALAPAVPKVVKPVARNVAEVGSGLGNLAMSPVQTMKGVVGGFTNDVRAPNISVGKPWENTSARMPIGETYIPAPVLEAYRAGQLTADQATALSRPTTELPLSALQRTQGLVPFKGQEARAAGEQFGSGYRDPYKAAAEVGLDVLTAGGIPTLARLGAKGWDLGKTAQAYKQLGQSGFSPLTPQEAVALQSRPPMAGPVVPTAPPPPPATLQSLRQPPKPAPTPAATAQQAAAAQVAPPATPIQAAAQQTVAQKAQQVMGDKYRAPVVETPAPIAGPAVPAGPIVETTPRKLTLDEIMAQINKKNEGVFTTAGETPAAPLDIETVRTNFANQIEQQRKAMSDARAENKTTYAGTQESLGKTDVEPVKGYAGPRGAFTPPKSEVITTDAALKDMIKASGDVKSYKKNIIVNRNAYNDFATDAGVALDWSTAPDVSKMGVADARKATNKWVYDTIKREAPELGIGVRGETAKTQMNRANANLAFEELSKSPEQVAQEAAQMKAALENRKRLRRPDNLEMKTGPQLEDITGAAQDVMLQKFETKGESFNTSYTHKGDTVYETKSPGYHSVELEHPDGSRTVFKAHQYGPNAEYTKMTFDKVGRPTPVERSSTPFPDFVTVENVAKTSGGTPPSGVMEMRTATPSTVKFGEQELPVTKRKSDWMKDQLFNKLGGDDTPTAYRSGSNTVVDAKNPLHTIKFDGKPMANEFAQSPTHKTAYDIASGKRAPANGSKFTNQDAPFTIEDIANGKMPRDKKLSHYFVDDQPDTFDTTAYKIAIDPKGFNNVRKVKSTDKITEVYEGEQIEFWKLGRNNGKLVRNQSGSFVKDVTTHPDDYFSFHRAYRGLTPDGRHIFEIDNNFAPRADDKKIIQRYVGKDISKENPEWFRTGDFWNVDPKDIRIVYKPTNPKMKTQEFTVKEYESLFPDKRSDAVINDIPLPSTRRINSIFDTKKKGK